MNSSQPKSPGLIPALGLFSTVMLVIGGVIGSGIFRKSGLMAGELGSPEWLLFVWILAGVITMFGAFTNAEIASMIPETGGQYVYFERMYGPFFAFLYGWALFAIIQCGSIAAVAFLFAEYCGRLVDMPEISGSAATWAIQLPGIGKVTPLADIGTKGLAAALIIILTVVNYLGVKFGGIVQNISTVAKVGAMALLMLCAFLPASGGAAANLTTNSITVEPTGFPLVLALAGAMAGAFWAYDGWNKITYVAGEVKEPHRNIPRGLLWGMLIVTAIYVLMNVAYLYVLPVDELAKSKKFFVFDVAEKIVAGGGNWVAVAVMISTFGAVNAIILASARVYFHMARVNVFPNFLGRVHPTFHTPGASLVLQGIWSVLLLFSGTFDTLTDTLIFVSWIFYAAGAYGIFILRKKMPDAPRPYKVPGYPVVPWVFVIFSIVYLVLTVYNEVTLFQAGKAPMINSLFGTVLVLIGVPIYFFYRTRNKVA